MCGLVACIKLDGKMPDRGVLERMAATIGHRGPDDEGVLVSGAVGMAHRRLSIIDIATGHQPMSVDGVSVVFNGEIYNYVELREELRRQGHSFRTTSDTEVLLRLYLEHGPEFVALLNGMFAFVLHDEQRKRIVSARDHFGIKPLYVHCSPTQVLFASEIKALLMNPALRAEVDSEGLDDYVTLQYTLGERTLFRGIRKHLPAHVEVLDLASGTAQRLRYWQPNYQPELGRNEASFVEELKSLLADSVRRQMRSDVPVGAYLSGGLDSSTVALLAARESPQALHTFTGAFSESPDFDESAYAREVAESCGARMSLVYPTEREFIDLLPRLAYHMDEPAAGPGLFPQFIVSRLAATKVKVCLGGQGGDEIFGGYARYAVASLEQSLKSAIFGNDGGEPDVPLGDLAPSLPSLRQYVPMLDRYLKQGLFEPFERRYFSLVDRSEASMHAYHRDFRARHDRNAVFGRFQAVFDEPDTPSPYNRMLHYDLMTGLPSLLHVEDRVSMAVSLESRVPLLDPQIVEFMAKVPPAVKFKGGEMKYLFKQAVKDLLPPAILNRKDKMGFPVPLQHWARGQSRSFFHDVLLSKRAKERGLFDVETVERLIEQESAYGRVLWGLLQLELWHRQFIDGDALAKAA